VRKKRELCRRTVMIKEMYAAKLHVRRRHLCYRRGKNHCEIDVMKCKVMGQQ
jgi:hypothetical protein